MDIYEALLSGTPTEQEKIQALASKLRGKQGFGQLGVLTGDEVLSKMGGDFLAQSAEEAKTLGGYSARRRELEAQDAMARANDAAQLARQQEEQRWRTGQNALDRALQRELEGMQQAGANSRSKVASADEADYDPKAVERLSKQLEATGIPALEQSFMNFEEVIKPYEGKDIPGMGRATNVLPAMALSDEGKTVRQSLASIRNQVLKARSGAAVTAPEQARVYEEIGTLLGGSDEQVLQGLEMLRNTMEAQKGNVLRGYGDAEIMEYERRGSRGKKGAAPSKAAPSKDPADYASYEEYVQAMGGG